MLVVSVLFWQKGKGIFVFWRFMEARKEQLEQKKREGVSVQEGRALEEVLETYSSYKKNNFSSEEDFRFIPDTLRLISKIASIYYPGENEPMGKARTGDERRNYDHAGASRIRKAHSVSPAGGAP
jgi:hypothetical protein